MQNGKVDRWNYKDKEWFITGVKAVKKALFQQPELMYEQADYVLSQVCSDLANEKEQNIIRPFVSGKRTLKADMATTIKPYEY